MRPLLSLTTCALGLAAVLGLAASNSQLQAQIQPGGRKLAFLVGVKTYDHAQLKPLEYPERDVEEFAEVLKSAGFTVVLLTTTAGEKDASRVPTVENIHKQLEVLLKKVTRQDLILVGLAGHGIQPLGSDSAYFCPQDANPTIKAGEGKEPSSAARPDTLLSIDSLMVTLDDSGVGQKLLLMDACRNDPGVRGRRGIDRVRVSALPSETGVLLSCSSGQYAFEHKSWGGGHGAFFHQVIEGLKGGAVDADEGGVTWDSLVKHVRKRVPTMVADQYGESGGEQEPNLIANMAKRLPLLLRTLPKSTEPAALTFGNKPGQEWSDNGLKMKFCWCPPGKFTMGSPPDEPERDVNENQVEVTLSKGFWLGKYEVTQGEFRRLMGTTLVEQREKLLASLPDKSVKTLPNCGEGDSFPMYYVEYAEAVAFGEKLTEQERASGRLPANWKYSLPTEAQWEYGCRSGATTATAFGNSLSSKQANFDGTHPYNGGEKGEYRETTMPVGSFSPNRWGVCDMHGNVTEYCLDWLTDKLPGGTDPLVVVESEYRSSRGGAYWYSKGKNCRSAYRDGSKPDGRGSNVGFRLVAGPDRR